MPDNRPSNRRAYNFIAEDRMSDRNHDDTRPSVTWSEPLCDRTTVWPVSVSSGEMFGPSP